MRVAVLGLGALLSCAITATASAATLENSGGKLTFTAAAGELNRLDFGQADDGTATVAVYEGAITIATGCTAGGQGTFSCPGVTSVAIDTGDLDDSVNASLVRVPVALAGGSGDDRLLGGTAADAVDGGPGNDTLLGGPGDVVSGGSGIDVGQLPYSPTTPSVDVSLDGSANDGEPGAVANFLDDIEDVRLLLSVPSAITGNAGPNELEGGAGNDTLDGKAGHDSLFGDGGDDTLLARDAEPDRVDCGPGADTAVVDQYDQVGDSCETVLRELVLNPLEDRAPTISWTAPASAQLRANPTSTLQVDAADDRGLQSVTFLDDGRVVCTDVSAPFTCAYLPLATDVGRDTLVAVATDTLGQTAAAVRAVEVKRFEPTSVSLRVSRRGTRYTATGKLTVPARVPCSGTVTVRGGGSVRTGIVGRKCTYRVVLTARGKAPFTTTYEGTGVIAPKRSVKRGAIR